jgi:hypothetical protein
MVTVPVSLSPSTLNAKVLSIVPLGPSIDAFQMPEASAAKAASENTAIKARIQKDFIVYAPPPASVPFPAPPRINLA